LIFGRRRFTRGNHGDSARNGVEVPWSQSYRDRRWQFTAASLDDLELMARFRDGGPLPSGYGKGLDERCVEYPWVLSRLEPGSARVLDAGSTLNYRQILDQPIWRDTRLHIVTLAPEHQAFWDRGISYLYEDLRELPMSDGVYDTVVSISTLEHVGMDNREFTGRSMDAEPCPRGHLRAIAELRRVLEPGGTLLATVPFGRPLDLGTARVFDQAQVDEMVDAFDPKTAACCFFRYTDRGWQTALSEECTDCEYVPWVALPPDQRPAAFPVQADGAAAARAVACLELTTA